MATARIASVKFYGVSACVPKNVLRIADYAKFTPEKAASFSKQTGIVERRAADKDLAASDMCLRAAQDLLADLKVSATELDAVIFVSQSMDYPLPATACILQNRLGATKACMAFDMGLGCSGYVYGLSVAASLAQSMRLKNVLLLAGENALIQHHPENTSSYPLFGDAGTATLIGYAEGAPDIFFDFGTDGAGYRHIIREVGGVRHPVTDVNPLEWVDVPDGGGAKMRRADCFVAGAPIMEFCLREVKPSAKRVLEAAGLGVEQIDLMFAHQANRLINETVRKLCGVPKEKHPYSIELFGNTSVASIPLTMAASASEALRTGAKTNLLCGFGVGLSWGSVVLRTDHIACPPLAEV